MQRAFAVYCARNDALFGAASKYWRDHRAILVRRAERSGATLCHDITPERVLEWCGEERSASATAALALKAFLGWAKSAGVLVDSGALAAPAPRRHWQCRHSSWSDEDEGALQALLANPAPSPSCRFTEEEWRWRCGQYRGMHALFLLGLRQEEVCQLRWSHVDRSAGTIEIPWPISPCRSLRVIPLRRIYPEFFALPQNSGALIFSSGRGEPWTLRQVGWIQVLLGRRLKRELSLRSLRTYAVDRLRQRYSHHPLLLMQLTGLWPHAVQELRIPRQWLDYARGSEASGGGRGIQQAETRRRRQARVDHIDVVASTEVT